NRGTALRNADLEQVGVREMLAAVLREAAALVLVDGEQPRIDRREHLAREDGIHALNETLGLQLPLVSARQHIASREARAETLVETPLARAGDERIVQEVVRDRVEHAVGEQRGAKRYGTIEQHLQAVTDPDVAKRLP